MANATAIPAWKTVLPQVFSWLDDVQIEFGAEVGSGGIYAIPVVAKSDKDGGLQVAPGCKHELAEKAMSAAKQIGWKGKSGALKIVVDGNAVALLPLTRVKTTARQISRQFGMDLGRAIKDDETKALAVVGAEDLYPDEIFAGISAGFYNPGIFKGSKLRMKSSTDQLPAKVTMVGFKPDQNAMETQKHLAKATTLTRMMQDAPANWLDPEMLGQIAEDFSKQLGLSCKRLGRSDLEAMGAGLFLSVAAGSPKEPQLITITIDGEDNSRTVALVGKGLTFDAGGNSLKAAAGMGEMKYDMSGGAAVLGAAYFLGHVKPPTRVVCVVGAVENMPGGTATRPGDIVQSMSGKTVDIQNTDAEGRLVLADCLHYAQTQYSPELIVDAATLTGACLHALGHNGGAVMSPDQRVADFVLAAAEAVGEPFWQLPLWPELDREVKSDVSDLVNIAKPNVRAGTLVAGMFLKEFINEGTAWAHLDVAGTSWSCKATGYPANGGSGYTLRTLAEVCRRFGEWPAK